MSNNVIDITNLSGGYEDKQVLEGLSLNIKQGGFTAIAGPNGAGKSTILKYLIKELKTNNKTIEIFNTDINALKQKELAHYISFQGQSAFRNEEFTVYQVVALGRYSYNDVENCSSKVIKALETTGIIHLKDKLITKISGGEFQLTMLARTICQEANILALDEPANNLDPKHQLMLLNLLSNISKQGKTVLCVMHDLNAILRYCDNCILVKDGKVFAQGETSKVLTQDNIKQVYQVDCRILNDNETSYIVYN